MSEPLVAHRYRLLCARQAEAYSWLASSYQVRPEQDVERRAVGRALYRTLLCTTLMKAALCPDLRPAMFDSLLDFVEGRRSFEGLETIFLSLLLDSARCGRARQHRAALQLWERYGSVVKVMGAGPMGFFDFGAQRLSLLSRKNSQSLRPGGRNAGLLERGRVSSGELQKLASWEIEGIFPGGSSKPRVLQTRAEKGSGPRGSGPTRHDMEVLAAAMVLVGIILETIPIPPVEAAGFLILATGAAIEVGLQFGLWQDQKQGPGPSSSIDGEVPATDVPPGSLVGDDSGGDDGRVGVYGGSEADGGDGLGEGEEGGEGDGCFDRATRVLMADGSLKRIGEIRCGESVRARDKSGALVDREVVQTHAHRSVRMARIQLPDGEVIRATPAHRFWTERNGFVAAHELQPGMRLNSADAAREAVVQAVGETCADAEDVFNLSVGSDHTFFVGESSVLVHNRKLAGPMDV